MRREDMDRLRQPYTDDQLAMDSPGERVAHSIGVRVPALEDLAAELTRDLDPTVGGFGWWAGTVDAPRRMVIADHMTQAATEAVRTALVEARVHELELREAADAISGRMRAHLSLGGAAGGHFYPAPRSAADELPGVLDDLHVVGFFRALASALDALAVLVVGVVGLPLDVYRIQWRQLDEHLASLASKGGAESAGAELQQQFGRWWAGAVAAAGPAGWLPWTIEMRNMLVHRPRLLGWSQGRVPGGGRLILPGGPGRHIDVVRHLPRWPGLSTAEGIHRAKGIQEFSLEERGHETMAGVAASTLTLVEDVSAALRLLWLHRRAEPGAIVQPAAKQWKWREVPAFAGYAPGSLPFSVDLMNLHPGVAARLEAAGVMSSTEHLWDVDDDMN